MTMHQGIVAGVLLVLLAGCGSSGPDLYKVTGKVTLDGKPLPDAEIWFLPVIKGNEQARSATAITDAAGYYSLNSSNRYGAMPGTYQVSISTKREAMSDVPAVPETVPDIYNTKTTLQAEVGRKSEKFNFDLVSTAGTTPGQPTATPNQ